MLHIDPNAPYSEVKPTVVHAVKAVPSVPQPARLEPSARTAASSACARMEVPVSPAPAPAAARLVWLGSTVRMVRALGQKQLCSIGVFPLPK